MTQDLKKIKKWINQMPKYYLNNTSKNANNIRIAFHNGQGCDTKKEQYLNGNFYDNIDIIGFVEYKGIQPWTNLYDKILIYCIPETESLGTGTAIYAKQNFNISPLQDTRETADPEISILKWLQPDNQEVRICYVYLKHINQKPKILHTLKFLAEQPKCIILGDFNHLFTKQNKQQISYWGLQLLKSKISTHSRTSS